MTEVQSMRVRTWIGMGICALLILLAAMQAHAHDPPPPPSKAEAMRGGAGAEPNKDAQKTDAHNPTQTENPQRKNAQNDATQKQDVRRLKHAWKRVEVTYLPSFSPHPKISYRWSVRGGWIMASRTAQWPPPIPDAQHSELLGEEESEAMNALWDAALAAMEMVNCAAETQLQRGEVFVRIEAKGHAEEVCLQAAENPDTSALDTQLRAWLQQTPHGAQANRWTHPFWLVESSSRLRLELRGTAELYIDGTRYGRINGVLALRLPVGERVLTLQPLDGGKAQEVRVRLRTEETTIVRISVEDEAMRVVPSWSQPGFD